MQYSYNITHDKNGKERLEELLENGSPSLIEAFNNLPDFLGRLYNEKEEITIKNFEDTTNIINIKITSDKPESEIKNELAKHLVTYNYLTEGLSFIFV